uniref:Uncharacterized protein n=1 Tax=Anguilla anguilla TaxID=7936 RepID=A0A0E9TXS3_ANGAN
MDSHVTLDFISTSCDALCGLLLLYF